MTVPSHGELVARLRSLGWCPACNVPTGTGDCLVCRPRRVTDALTVDPPLPHDVDQAALEREAARMVRAALDDRAPNRAARRRRR